MRLDVHAQLSGTSIVLKISFKNGTLYVQQPNSHVKDVLGLQVAFNFIGKVLQWERCKNTVNNFDKSIFYSVY